MLKKKIVGIIADSAFAKGIARFKNNKSEVLGRRLLFWDGIFFISSTEPV